LAVEHVKQFSQEEQPLEEAVVKVFRCSKVVKGGRRFSFAALVVVGDRAGTVAIGYGKANEVPLAVEKGLKDAKKSLHKIVLVGRTIPHQVTGKYRATKIILVPASPGTGERADIRVGVVLAGAGAAAGAKPAVAVTKAAAAEPGPGRYRFMKVDRCLCLGGCPNAVLVITSSQHATRLSMYHNWRDLTTVQPSGQSNYPMPG